MDSEAEQRRAEDAALRAIVEGVEAETGDGFFLSLVRHLASALAVQYAFVSEISEARTHFRTRAVWGRGTYLQNFEIPIVGTPCEAVLNGQMSHHPERLQALFPEDTGLAEWGVESYCGVPLLDSDGTVLGHLAIFDDRPMPDGPRGIAIMRIFAARARAEIVRLRMEAALRASETRLARILDSAMDAIVTIDDGYRIELFNKAAEKVFGFPATEAIGQSFARFLTDGFGQTLEAAMRRLATGDQTTRSVWAPEGLRARRVNGREFAAEASISHVEVSGRRLFTLILRDVEERRRAQEELHRLHLQTAYLEEEIKATHNFEAIVARSAVMDEVLRNVTLVAATDSSVLVLGETGTGKELIARAVHSNSARKDRPFIKVNCAGLPTGLIESEIFGHEKGAFTGAIERRVGRFELADGGTIFLDEIGEVPLDLQAKLLRVLQEQEFERIGGQRTLRVDVRVIAATNRNLEKSVADGTFRQDLYYRLNVFPVRLPPLRERPEDIPLLVHYFLGRYTTKLGRKITSIPAPTMERLIGYGWPGNVRELENVIERAVILSRGLDLEVPTDVFQPSPPQEDAPVAEAETRLSLEELERRHILSVLRQTRWRVDGPRGAARLLQIHPSTLRSRMHKLGIRRDAGTT